MEFSVKSGNPEKQRTACLVVGVYERRRMSAAAQSLDTAAGGFIGNLLRRGDIEGKLGQSLLLYNVPGVLAERVMLVGCGVYRDLDDGQYAKVIARSARSLKATGVGEAVSFLTDLPVKGRDSYWRARHAVVFAREALYRFDRLKSEKDRDKRPLRRVILSVPRRRDLPGGERAVRDGTAVADAIDLAKDLGNLPANVCTPSYLAEQATGLADRFDAVSAQILDEQDMEKLGMGALLSVARGTREPPRLIVLRYAGAGATEKPHVLVGKGVTFDAGGISLKPAQAMDEMKYDMAGAAAVLGTLQAAAELALPLNVIGLIPSTENLPGGSATKPGDIVTSMSGQTIEILNTDAEGRLILCDTLTYAERYEPAAVIDIATLTGACVAALGRQAAGLLSSHATLANELLAAGQYTRDRAWQLPLWPEYKEQLKSNFADMANIGGPEAGVVTAACFLWRFTKKLRWAHLDIAGTAWLSGKEKGATGRPVALLCQYLMDRAKKT